MLERGKYISTTELPLFKRKYKIILKMSEEFKTATLIKSSRGIGQPTDKLIKMTKVQGPYLSLSPGFDATFVRNF
jgi:hypothetical protein